MLLLATLAVSIIYLLFYVTRKKHPKGYPPGPIGVPLLGYMPWLAPDPHVQIGKLGKKYGNIFSVQLGNYSFVVLNDLKTIKTALKMDVFAARPNHLLAMSFVKLGLAFSDGPGWVEQRRFALKTLRDFGFGKKSMEASIQEEVSDLVDYFRSQVNKSIHVKEIFSISIVNALWQIVAGEKFSLDDPKPRKFFKVGQEGFMDPEIQGVLYVMPWLAQLFPDSTGYSKMLRAAETLKATLRELIKQHQDTFIPGSNRDYIDMYLQKMSETTDPNSSFYKELGVENLVDGLINLFMAGSDTLTSTMEFTLLFLIAHPDVRVKVQEEIDQVVGRTRVPEITDRQSMPYLEAVMQESLRLSSVVTGSIAHSVTEDTEFMGYYLPKGTIVMPNLYQIHHNVEYWKDPKVFRPERFINADGTFRKDENVIPFSTGKRVCMAETLAMTEYFLFLSNILQVFDIHADPKHPLPGFEARKPAFVLSPHEYRIIFKNRA